MPEINAGRLQIIFKRTFFLLLPLSLDLVSFNNAHLTGVHLPEETYAVNKSIKDISLTMLMKEKINSDYFYK